MPERARILVREMPAVIEVENHARKSRRIVIAVVRKIARHPEMQAEPDVIGIHEEMLAMPMYAAERVADERPQRSRAEDTGVEDADSGDGLPECMTRKVAR